MAVVINGTTGITSVNGSAAAPSVTGTDTDTGIVYGTNTLSLATGGTTAVTVDSSQQVTFAQAANLPNTFGFKNRIINGAMMIDQRNAGASVTPNSGATYTIDRWALAAAQAGKFTVQQNAGSVTPPAGFKNYLGATSTSAYSIGSNDYFTLQQSVEGLNVADLGWGAAGAQPITISFWVRSSLTGTFGGSLNNSNGTRSYPFSYTISSANTWEQKSVTVAGDTTGTWLTTNGIGIAINFSIGMGSTYSGTANTWAGTAYYSTTGATSVVGTSGATFYITGVQLEKGSTATSFDYRPYGTELALCQRYYFKDTTPASLVFNSAGVYSSYQFKVTMRATPTVTALYATGLASTNGFYANSGGVSGSGVEATAEL